MDRLSASVQDRLGRVRLLATDVDGVLTDGGIIFSSGGSETKRFDVADGLGIRLLINSGIKVAWITGRTSEAVAQRARDLGISRLVDACPDKSAVLASMAMEWNVPADAVAFMGDDLNDLGALAFAGVAIAPANACAEVLAIADVVCSHRGGHGAVREVAELILKAAGLWEPAVDRYRNR